MIEVVWRRAWAAYPITAADLDWAREQYTEHEPRALFYRAAIALMGLATRGKPALTTAETLAVLLQTWNKAYYQYRPFDRRHLAEIDRTLEEQRTALTTFRERSIEESAAEDETMVMTVFAGFEQVLGPVGAAKALHLLAPNFFPLWDRGIAKGYCLTLRIGASNADRYCEFMRIAREQVKSLGGEQGIGRNALKAIDEYNYCKYSLKKTKGVQARAAGKPHEIGTGSASGWPTRWSRRSSRPIVTPPTSGWRSICGSTGGSSSPSWPCRG
jgi:hypothetical protein